MMPPPEALRHIRKYDLRMTQGELAEALGVTRITLTKWETGSTPIGNWRMLSLALDSLKGRQ